MLHNFFIGNSFKSKLKFIGKFGCILDIVEKWVWFDEGDAKFFRRKVWEELNFE